MTVDHDQDDDRWKDPPEGALELIRAAREAPPMTPEEEDRAVAHALAVVAAAQRKATRKRRAKRAVYVGLGVAVAGGEVTLALRARPPAPKVANPARSSREPALMLGYIFEPSAEQAPRSRARDLPWRLDSGKVRRPRK